ncbi:MAG: hypothetical protein HC828_17830 [Blastochloris sp.]|nr:hypothetical protein [Blastochloris sp.]
MVKLPDTTTTMEEAMSSHPYDTSRTDAWHQEIVPQLPPDRAAQATALGAYVRYRYFTNATDLLRGLLAYAATTSSLRDLGAWGVLQDVADLAPSSWLDRRRAAGPWLQWIVTTRLQIPRPRWVSQVVRGRVLLIDASCLDGHGGRGNEFRLHLAVDLLAGQLDQGG